MFIALAIMAATLSHTPVSEFGDRVRRMTLLAPTIFPIIFAAVLGKSLKSIAGWKLEKGEKLGVLELLAGSQSVFGSLAVFLGLRMYSILGICTVLMWCLSPLGGQASLRLLFEDTVTSNSTANMAYFNNSAQETLFCQEATFANSLNAINALYSTSLMSSNESKVSHEDLWGNIKLPRPQSLPQAGVNQWIEVPYGHRDFISLIGIPLAGKELAGAMAFEVEHMYYEVQCNNVSKIEHTYNQNTSRENDWFTPLNVQYSDMYNPMSMSASYPTDSPFFTGTKEGPSPLAPLTFRNLALQPAFRGRDNDQYIPSNTSINFDWFSKSCDRNSSDYCEVMEGYSFVTMAQCNMTPRYISAHVVCHDSACRADKVKPIDDEKADVQVFVGYDFGASPTKLTDAYLTFALFMGQFSLATLTGNATILTASTPTESFIYGNEEFPFTGRSIEAMYK